MGLRLMARDMGLSDPELFTDPAYKKSGGDGSYVLSTSFVGYTPTYGAVAPMQYDGYGCFYNISAERLGGKLCFVSFLLVLRNVSFSWSTLNRMKGCSSISSGNTVL